MRLSEKIAVGYAYGTSLLSYMVDGPARPFSATFAVTNRCNLRCEYCNCPFIDPSNLALPQIETMFDRLQQMGVRRLGLAGGEPTLRADLGEIVEMAKARKFFVSINSNLTLYSRHPERLWQGDLIYTSLDGDAAAHNAARGERAFEGVLEAIEDLIGRGKPVIAICVVTEHSIGQSEFLLAQAERLGFRLHFQPQCVDTEIVRGEVSGALSNESIRQFWRGLGEQKRKGRPIVSSTPYLELLSKWEDFSVSAYYDADTRCPAGHGYIYIDPQGKAWACAYTKGLTKPVDLLSQDWQEAWTKDNPCTRCTVGPMLEFNLLFQRPLSAIREGIRTYG
ncbi:MAG TPA: radical SAM protein [Candidatus Binatia bacterium]|nr:radical SAM protein [Candidatus Binatia bacterium]